jgi:Zn-finger protein
MDKNNSTNNHHSDGTKTAKCDCSTHPIHERGNLDDDNGILGSPVWVCRNCGKTTHRRTPTTAKRRRMTALLNEFRI